MTSSVVIIGSDGVVVVELVGHVNYMIRSDDTLKDEKLTKTRFRVFEEM